MTIWNFVGLQKKIQAMSIKTTRGEVVYSQEAIDALFKIIARSIPVDANYYLTSHPDLAEASVRGELLSPVEHYVEHGFYEDRLPCRPYIEEAAYLARYPDVAQAIQQGAVASATDHWIEFGRFEEREANLRADEPR